MLFNIADKGLDIFNRNGRRIRDIGVDKCVQICNEGQISLSVLEKLTCEFIFRYCSVFAAMSITQPEYLNLNSLNLWLL